MPIKGDPKNIIPRKGSLINKMYLKRKRFPAKKKNKNISEKWAQRKGGRKANKRKSPKKY